MKRRISIGFVLAFTALLLGILVSACSGNAAQAPTPTVERKEAPTPTTEKEAVPTPTVKEEQEPTPTVEEEKEPTATVEEKEEPPAELDGKVLTEERCTKCHDLSRVERAQKTEDAWKTTVERMVSKGTELNEAEQKAVIEFLAETYPE